MSAAREVHCPLDDDGLVRFDVCGKRQICAYAKQIIFRSDDRESGMRLNTDGLCHRAAALLHVGNGDICPGVMGFAPEYGYQSRRR